MFVLQLEDSFENIGRFAVLSGDPSDFENNTVLDCVSVGFGETENGIVGTGYKTTIRVKFGPEACKIHKGYLKP